MENLQVKVHEDKVFIGYTSLESAEESFYEEFGLKEYRNLMNAFRKDHQVELEGKSGKLRLACVGENTKMTYSKPSSSIYISGKNLCKRFFV